MVDRTYASTPRLTREYFSTPRTEKSDVKRGRRATTRQYSGSSDGASKNATVTIMPRPTAILSKPKEEPSKTDQPENDQQTASQTVISNQSVTPSGTNRPGSVSPNPIRPAVSILNSVLRADKTQSSRGVTPTPVEQPLGIMKAAVRLLSDTMDFTDVVADYLSSTNTNFTVIGVIGPQGTGKSTLLSMLAGNDHLDMYRYYAFRPASREAIESCRHQSQKISIYVTKSRMILLDCQAICSASVLSYLLSTSPPENCGGRPGSSKAMELCRGFTALSGEVESLQLTAFLLQVCHTVILSVDWFIDIDVVRHIRTAEMLRVTPTHYSPETVKYKPNRGINFVLAHQRARSEDFRPRTVRNRAKILESLFLDSQLNIKSGVSLGGLGCKPYAEISPDINYVLLSEMKPRPKADVPAVILPYVTTDYTPLRFVIDYEEVIRPLRSRLLSLPKQPFVLGNQPFTEIQWYEFATRCWRATQASADIAKYASLITRDAADE